MITYLCLLCLIILDQLMKYWVVANIPLHTGQDFISGIVSLFYIRNTGAAWGLFADNIFFFIMVTIVFLIAIIWWFHKKERRLTEKIAYSLIMAGAIGNFIDRVQYGYVVDMFKFEFINFPIFNIADICLTIGVIVMLYDGFLVEGKKHGK